MLVIAHQIVRYPWLQLIGGAYLVYLGIEHLGEAGNEKEGEGHVVAPAEAPNFWHVVVMVELADLVFSLDNVVAAVALADHIVVVLIGVALGILALRWAASYFAIMVEKEPILQDAAYVLVLVIGLRFCLEHFFEFEIPPTAQFGISIGILALSLLYAHWSPLRVLHPFVHRARRIIHQVLTAIKQALTFRTVAEAKAESGEERG
jgi:tellurite resistance protein TerC